MQWDWNAILWEAFPSKTVNRFINFNGSDDPKDVEMKKEIERNPIMNKMVITEDPEVPPLKTDQDSGFKKQISELFG